MAHSSCNTALTGILGATETEVAAGVVQNVAQLWTFGNFPSHVKPFIFSWPTGQLLAYPVAQSIGAESEETAQALKGRTQRLAIDYLCCNAA
eukprot:scaffold231009_cov48-Prasinocladus_malaysianus.AAC.1